MDGDFILRNASIVDGSGTSSYSGHVFVSGNKIEAIYAEGSDLSDQKAQIIDVAGQTVMPGLIDAHCHISFDEPVSNDELFFHRREGLASIIAGTNALKVLQS